MDSQSLRTRKIIDFGNVAKYPELHKINYSSHSSV